MRKKTRENQQYAAFSPIAALGVRWTLDDARYIVVAFAQK